MIGRYRCRCRYCERRKTLGMHPEHYVRMPRCGCRRERMLLRQAIEHGRPKPMTWRVDKYRNTGREQRATGTCRCDQYSHPHARARGWCRHNPKITIEMLEQRSAWS